jgi:hypothetical protein
MRGMRQTRILSAKHSTSGATRQQELLLQNLNTEHTPIEGLFPSAIWRPASDAWQVNAAAPISLLHCSLHSHAQPLASSMVSARSAVVLTWSERALLRSLRTSLASMLMLATSFTMQATFSFEFSSR